MFLNQANMDLCATITGDLGDLGAAFEVLAEEQETQSADSNKPYTQTEATRLFLTAGLAPPGVFQPTPPLRSWDYWGYALLLLDMIGIGPLRQKQAALLMTEGEYSKFKLFEFDPYDLKPLLEFEGLTFETTLERIALSPLWPVIRAIIPQGCKLGIRFSVPDRKLWYCDDDENKRPYCPEMDVVKQLVEALRAP